MKAYVSGIRRVLAFYGVGLIAVVAFHLLVGWKNQYAPPMSVVVLAGLLICGLPWMALNLVSLIWPCARKKALGELTIHAVVYFVSVCIVLMTVK